MKKTQKNVIFRTPRFDVIKHDFYDNFNRANELYYLDKKNSVLIVAISGDKLIIIENYRDIIQKQGYELPGGRIEKEDFSAIDAAKRELFEETGLMSDKWCFLGKTYPLPSVTNEAVFIFHAEISENLSHEKWNTKGEDGLLRILTIPICNAITAIRNNEFTSSVDAYAIILYLMTKKEDANGKFFTKTDNYDNTV